MTKRRDDILDEDVQRMYYEEGMTKQEIAYYYGVSYQCINYRLHPEKQKERNDNNKESKKKYNHSDKGKATTKRFWESEKGKEVMKIFNQSEEGKEVKKRYFQTDKGRVAKSKVNQSVDT